MANYTSGEQFINKLYNNLINSEEVKRSVEKARKKGIKISNREDMLKAYFDRLEDVHDITRNRKLTNDNDSEENNEVRKESQIELKLKVLKHFYYEKYLIKELPEDYIELQKKIAKERGYGDINVTEEMKEKMLEEVRNEQKTSLDSWISYLMSSDAMYPTWFKFYAFQGMVKLGKFDKEKGEFTKRTSNTVTPFIELNPEILGQMYSILQKTINKEELTDKEEQALSNGESFKKLYKYFLVGNYKDQENLEETKGVWIKYNQGDNYKSLWQSLQGKNTGWCTAGEETCKRQVKSGDFYVYYTYDKEGKPTNPRIAIRMNGKNKIGEIRGIGKSQNLEPEMFPILNEKLKEFPDKDKYLKKEYDMKFLTEIDNKVQNGEELTKDELRFLYEIDNKIEGFGFQKDPRINEIKQKRNIKKDLSKYFGCDENAIVTSYDEINHNTKVVFYNDKAIFDSEVINQLTFLKEISLKENTSELTKEETEYLYSIKTMNPSLVFKDKLKAEFLKLKQKRNIKKDLSKYFECDENAIATSYDEINHNTKAVFYNDKVIFDSEVINELTFLKEISLKENTSELTKEETEYLYSIKTMNPSLVFKDKLKAEFLKLKQKRNIKKDLSKYFECDENAIATSYDEINHNTKAVFYNNKVIFDSEVINALNVSKGICLKENTSELTKEEIEYLYGIKHLSPFKDELKIEFLKLKQKRNIKKDLSKYFECDENSVATCVKEINLNTIIAYIDNEFINSNELQKYKELLKIYNYIKTEKTIKEEYKTIVKKHEVYHTFKAINEIISKLKLLFNYNNIAKSHGILFENVAWTEKDLMEKNDVFMYVGDLKIEDTKVPDYLKSLKYIYGNVDFGKLESAEGLENLKVIHGDADFHSLKSGNGLCNLQEVFGEIDLSNVVDIGNFNQKIKITPKNEYVTYDAYSPPLILSEKFFTSENISNIKSNTRFEKYLINYYDDFYEKNSNVTYRRIYKGASEKELEKQLNTWAKEDALINEDNLEEKNNVDYSSYRNLDDLIDFYERNGKWPEYIDNPVSNEDFINNELYEYRQELLEEEDYLDDDEREKLLDVDPSFFESYIY